MKIGRIEVFQLTLPLKEPYSLSGGRLRFEALDSTVVAVTTDTGLTGWGEGCPWGATYLPAFGKGIRAVLDELAPQLLGLDPRRLEVMERAMDQALPGHGYAKSALDTAFWDILGQDTGLPLCELMGGRTEEPVILHSSIPTGTADQMIAAVAAARARGYSLHSCKVGPYAALDIPRIEALHASLPEGESLAFDANRSWLPDQAIQVINATAALGHPFEQPCETLEECAAVRRATHGVVFLDENIVTIHDLARAQREGLCEGIGLKIGRVGGLTKARRLRDFCLAFGLRMNIEETGGSVIADTGAVHLAQATPASHRRATWLCHDMLTLDTATGGARNMNGSTRAPEAPGLGVTPDRATRGEAVAVYQ